MLGLLDDYPTRSGYVITPVVLWGGGRLDPQPAPDEVVAVYRVGAAPLRREDSHGSSPFRKAPAGGADPAGQRPHPRPDRAVLLQLRWLCLEGRHDPVDGLEQPVFAWQ